MSQGRPLLWLSVLLVVVGTLGFWPRPVLLTLNVPNADVTHTDDVLNGAETLHSASGRDPMAVEVYVFLSLDCPISNAYMPELNRLATQYAGHDVRFFGVVPGLQEDPGKVETFRQKFLVRFPLVLDRDYQITRNLSATHTPQAIVQANSKTVYSGRIDNRFADLAKARGTATQHDLADVLKALATGEALSLHQTNPIGCLITQTAEANVTASSDRTSETAGFTFSRDVAPVIFEHCSRCHRPGEAAPFSLLTFQDMRAHAAQIGVVVQRRLMPPWKAEPNFATFANEHRLSDEEMAIIRTWIASDQPEGDPEELPLTPIYAEGWQLGRPDVELIMPQSFDVPADGPDIYQHFVIPTGLSENRLVNAVEFRPGAPEVVHHSIMYFDTTGRGRELDAEDSQPGYSRLGSPGFAVSGSLGGWGPGGLPRRLPNGMGRLLEKDADLILQIHYHPIGRPVKDRSRVGLYFAPPSATHLVTEIMVANVELNIPPNESRHQHHAEYVLPVDTILFDATPHMHVLGKEIRAVAHRPDGTKEPLIRIREWDFYWQENYVYAQPLRLPAGTRIELDCWFDNSDQNALNPNSPPQTVRWGDYSTDEMGICYFQATTDTWDDYVELNSHATKYFANLWQQYQQNKQQRSAASEENGDADVMATESP